MVKVPLGTLVIFICALLISLRRWRKTQWKEEFVLLMPALVIFAIVSSKTGFSEHFRYVLPIFPFLFVWSAKVGDILFTDSATFRSRFEGSGWRESAIFIPPLLVAALFSWSIASSFWIYPHSLSYFNESIGAPLNGPEHLLGSNMDWGQDLIYASAWAEKNREDFSQFFLAHTCVYSPADLFINSKDWGTQQLERKYRPEQKSDKLICLIVSMNFLKGEKMFCRDFTGGIVSVEHESQSEDRFQIKNLDTGLYCGYTMRCLAPRVARKNND
jgi:hypothetical protein